MMMRAGPFSSVAPSEISRVEIGAGVDAANVLNKRLYPHFRRLAMSDITQGPRPFAHRLAVDGIVGSAANDGGK